VSRHKYAVDIERGDRVKVGKGRIQTVLEVIQTEREYIAASGRTGMRPVVVLVFAVGDKHDQRAYSPYRALELVEE